MARQQTVRLLLALSLLLVALVFILVKDREFWFGTNDAAESSATGSEGTRQAKASSTPAKVAPAPVAHAATAKNQVAPKTTAVKAVAEQASKNVGNPAAASSDTPVVTTKRAVLPPLDVEVIAGDTHRTVHPGSNVEKVEILGDSNRASAMTTSAASLTKNAAERERLDSESIPELRQNVDATYPLLGQHTRGQGSVVLQAVVGADGNIEDLRVLSGPAILSAAAQQAVRQWRFKPYLQNGQPVETKARITVNFSIRISDNPAKTT